MIIFLKSKYYFNNIFSIGISFGFRNLIPIVYNLNKSNQLFIKLIMMVILSNNDNNKKVGTRMYGDFASQEKRRSQENKSQVWKLKSCDHVWEIGIVV